MRSAVKKRIDTLKWSCRAGKMERLKSLDVAAQSFGLDLSDGPQRELLLFALAEAIFGEGRPGRKPDSKEWDGPRLIELALIDEKCCRHIKSDTKKAKLIFPKHKEFHSAETIRRRLPEARQMLELWREKMMDIGPPEGWYADDGDDRRDDYGD